MQIINDELVEKFVTDCAHLHHEEAPDVLFHYTSEQALRGIVTQKCLWMTHAFHMNDSAEFSHGMSMFKQGLNLLEDAGIQKDWLDRVRIFFDQEIKAPLAIPFVFSATQEGNQRGQWLEYGDSGRGVSIGIKTGVLTKVTKYLGGPVVVIYDEEIQRQIVQSVVESFIELARTLIKKLDNSDYVREFALAYFRVAYLQSVRFKSRHWRDEREWRYFLLAKNDNANIFARTRGERESKYFHLDLPAVYQLLTEVVLGPRADSNAFSNLTELQKSLGIDFKISQSALQGL